MPQNSFRSTLKHLLKGGSSVVPAVGGILFFVGGRAIHEFGGVDRTLAEIIGLGVAFLCLILSVVGKYKIEDIEWEEQNENAKREQEKLENKASDPRQ